MEGTSKFSNVIISGTIKSDDTVSSVYTEEMFTSKGNKVNQNLVFSSRFVGTVNGAGAVDANNDWTAGWTK